VLGANSALARNVFDGLVNQDDTQVLVPGHALSWTAPDATTWEFSLRDGGRFRDGSPFEAVDVAASLRRVASVKGSPSSFLPFVRPIKAVTVLDRLTLRIETAAPYPLLSGALSRIAIVPRGVERAGLEAFNAATSAHGTGPYRLVAYVPGERIVLARVASNRVMYIHLDSDRPQSPLVRDRGWIGKKALPPRTSSRWAARDLPATHMRTPDPRSWRVLRGVSVGQARRSRRLRTQSVSIGGDAVHAYAPQAAGRGASGWARR